MKLVALLALLLSAVSFSSGQNTNAVLIPFQENGLWGYMNMNKEVIVEPVYDEAYPTYHQMGLVKSNGKYGYINPSGEMIVKTKYDTVDYKFGYATLTRNGNTFNFDPHGKRIRQPVPSACGGQGPRLIPVPETHIVYKGQNGKYGLLYQKPTYDDVGNLSWSVDSIEPIFDTVVSLANQYLYVVKEGKISFTNSSYYHQGRILLLEKMDFRYDEIKFFSTEESDGVFPIVGIRTGQYWGYYDVLQGVHGKVLIEPKYLNITTLESGYALVEYLPHTYGYVDMFGNEFFTRTPFK